MTVDIDAWFETYEWSVTQVEPGIWRGSFAAEWEEDYELYAMLQTEWLRLIISPVTPRPTAEALPRLAETLLRMNQHSVSVRFGLDDDGDVCLLSDLFVEGLGYVAFEATLDMMIATVARLGKPLARMAVEPSYWPPELNALLGAR